MTKTLHPALAQIGLFWVAPMIDGEIRGMLYRWLSEEPRAQMTGVTPAPAE
jgi:aquaporin Z